MNSSGRQSSMLRLFVKPDGFYLSREKAQALDQRPFRSLLIRGWISFRPGRGFHITDAGREAWHAILHTDNTRTDPSRPLTSYFDEEAYGVVRVIPIRKGRVA